MNQPGVFRLCHCRSMALGLSVALAAFALDSMGDAMGQESPLTPNYPDLSSVPNDLVTPPMSQGQPAAGKRVRHQLDRFLKTDVYHALYLPENWQANQTYPVIVEYAGNGPYENAIGDRCEGTVEGCNLGYGISGGVDFIWICMPFVDAAHQQNQRQWWGDTEESVRYTLEAIEMVIEDFGGDPRNLFLCGFSRGSIACNYIGLHNDHIAELWAGFICHSHYDGVRPWNYPGSDRESATKRLQRLGGRPQFICQEKSVEVTRKYLAKVAPEGDFEFHRVPFRNHSDQWVLRDIPLRDQVRHWIGRKLLGKETKDHLPATTNR